MSVPQLSSRTLLRVGNMALKVPKRALPGPLKRFAETGSVVSKEKNSPVHYQHIKVTANIKPVLPNLFGL